MCHTQDEPDYAHPIRILPTVTRMELIDNRKMLHEEDRGRVFAAQNVQVELSYQDGGRTLKVFVTERSAR